MSVGIVDYASLQTSLTAMLTHTLFVANYPLMIQLFESEANRRLRVRQQETSTTLTTVNGDTTLPSDYLGHRRVTWLGSQSIDLEYVEPSFLLASYPTSPTGVPQIFTIEGSTMHIRPVDDTASVIGFNYFAKIPALGTLAPLDGTQTNWLLTAHPDLYLFGTMIEAELFAVNDERAPLWKARRDEIFDEIILLSNKSRGVGGMRIMSPTP